MNGGAEGSSSGGAKGPQAKITTVSIPCAGVLPIWMLIYSFARFLGLCVQAARQTARSPFKKQPVHLNYSRGCARCVKAKWIGSSGLTKTSPWVFIPKRFNGRDNVSLHLNNPRADVKWKTNCTYPPPRPKCYLYYCIIHTLYHISLLLLFC